MNKTIKASGNKTIKASGGATVRLADMFKAPAGDTKKDSK